MLSEITRYLETLRTAVRSGQISEADFKSKILHLEHAVQANLAQRFSPSLRKVINASGVIIHTNVGRAPISPLIAEVMKELATSYSNLEYNLAEGRRGHRDLHFERRMTRLLDCEAATVCNNSAAAVFLILNTLAKGKKVIVSRGELIEIGGSFRLPAIMEASGAVLKEVGTTNKTKIGDYRQAIDENVALILRVHPSNYKIVGFTHRPEVQELVELARGSRIPLVEDAGSGYLFPVSQPILRDEPTVQRLLGQGLDLVCFSGDKLLGGPQAGIIVGRRDLVAAIRKNPLMRACRVDKVTYATLEWTMIEYEKGTYIETLPIYRMLLANVEQIEERSEKLKSELDPRLFEAELANGHSVIGGGSAPEEPVPTCLLRVRSRSFSVNALEKLLREYQTPILARIEEDWLVLDLRTVFPEQEPVILSAFASIAAQDHSSAP